MTTRENGYPSNEPAAPAESRVNQALDQVADLLRLDPAIFENLKRDQSSLSRRDLLALGRVIHRHLREKQTEMPNE